METPADIIKLASRHGLDIEPESLQIDDIGLDFRVAHATDVSGIRWILRIPRRPDVMKRAGFESTVLRLMKRHTPVPVPDWRVESESFIAYPLLHGTPVVIVNKEKDAAEPYRWHLDPQDFSEDFLTDLASALVSIQTIDSLEAAKSGLPVVSPKEVRAATASRIAKARTQIPIPDNWWETWQTWLQDDSYWPEFSSLIHGDLHAAHILVNDNNRLSGILDWTEAKWGDPATDFAMLYMNFGSPALDSLIERYLKATKRNWPRMRDHVLYVNSIFPIAVAEFGLVSQNNQFLEQARQVLATPPDL